MTLALISAENEAETILKREISTRFLSTTAAAPREKPFEISDTRLPGFGLRVQPSGRRSYFVRWGRNRRMTLGSVGILTALQARERARRVLGNIAHERDPDHGLVPNAQAMRLGDFLNGQYRKFAESHYADPQAVMDRLKRCFGSWYEKEITEISPSMLDQWVAHRRKSVIGATVNRDIGTLGAALTRAVKWRLLPANPVSQIANCKVDSCPKTRHLSPDEQTRLYKALRKRDEEARSRRNRFNEWRRKRHCSLLPEIGEFSDHITPLVFLSLHTGCRRRELLTLTWPNVDFTARTITVVGRRAKSGHTRVISLNSEALQILTAWRNSSKGEFVFPSKSGKPMGHVKSAWSRVLKEAQIENFRWHDMRHTFASNLAMTGADLNTLRELMGHSGISMTLRYAHLSQKHKAEALEKLCA